MVGPLSSISSQQVPQGSTTQTANNNAQFRVQELDENDAQEIRPAGTSTAESQQTETRNTRQDEQRDEQQAASRQDDFTSSEERGSRVDISV